MARSKNGTVTKTQMRRASKTSLKDIRGVQEVGVKRSRKAGYGRIAKVAQAQVERFAKDGETPMEKLICEAMKNEGFRHRVIHYVARKLV